MKVKQVPEDFIVEEVARLKLDGGRFAYFKLRKRQWNTIDAVREIASTLGVKEKKLSFAGLKDRQAVTEQYVSAENVPREKLEAISIKDVEIEYLGQGSERMNSSMLVGNRFRITLRSLEKELAPVKFIPNYFDEQRFGKRCSNHVAGRALVKKDFKEACRLMGIRAEGNDYINELIKDKKLLKLCFNAYQSFLFNEALSGYVGKHYDPVDVGCCFGKLAFARLSKVDNFNLPLIHFDTELEGEIKMIYEKILDKEGIRKSDFLIRQLPNLVQLSPMRLAFVAVKGFTSEVSADELNKGKKKQSVSFRLPKGSYATIVLKAMEALQS